MKTIREQKGKQEHKGVGNQTLIEVGSPEPTWWRKRTNYRKFSFNLPVHVLKFRNVQFIENCAFHNILLKYLDSFGYHNIDFEMVTKLKVLPSQKLHIKNKMKT